MEKYVKSIRDESKPILAHLKHLFKIIVVVDELHTRSSNISVQISGLSAQKNYTKEKCFTKVVTKEKIIIFMHSEQLFVISKRFL